MGEFGGSIQGRQFDFTPRVQEALWLADHATIHAAIDVSDGLSLDLLRICEASGCGAEIELASVPIAAAARELANRSGDGSTALGHALSDGEDFELILAVPLNVATKLLSEQPFGVRLTRIGSFVAEAGLFAIRADGKREPLTPRGYEHRLDA
jgi:thiamine-monophosphate kinase